jgi:hypothetical protein
MASRNISAAILGPVAFGASYVASGDGARAAVVGVFTTIVLVVFERRTAASRRWRALAASVPAGSEITTAERD